MMSVVIKYLTALGVDFGIQAVGWIVSIIFKTEKNYDLFGSLTYITVTSISLAWSTNSIIQIVQSNLVFLWALRLGVFLFIRVIKTGEDRRFEEAKKNAGVMLVYWTLQGVWVFMTLLPTIILNTLPPSRFASRSIGAPEIIGWVLWGVGFSFEVIADLQKTIFRNSPVNDGKFIQSGLWSISRHPNYFGEILLWVGHYITCASVFRKYEFFSVLSPIFVFLLITKLSGVPLLEKNGKKKWGHLPEYTTYLEKTPVLIPFLKCC
ncbi:uncharacterized protein [Lepeophtheirus salmonis]|uniref:uncharacterized protein n=1 Tax=Lepeophtheirus salmonis TaxID=72036 RepID=UPI00077F261A|nr:uncharacterized protein LOC121130730 [Lepeophtheirus salmonis]